MEHPIWTEFEFYNFMGKSSINGGGFIEFIVLSKHSYCSIQFPRRSTARSQVQGPTLIPQLHEPMLPQLGNSPGNYPVPQLLHRSRCCCCNWGTIFENFSWAPTDKLHLVEAKWNHPTSLELPHPLTGVGKCRNQTSPNYWGWISNRCLKVMWNKSPRRDINPNPCLKAMVLLCQLLRQALLLAIQLLLLSSLPDSLWLGMRRVIGTSATKGQSEIQQNGQTKKNLSFLLNT